MAFSGTWQRALDGLVLSIFVAVSTLVVRLVRWQMDTFWSWYQERHWLPNEKNFAQDGKSVMLGVKMIETEQYGTGHREECHVLWPTDPLDDRVLVYIHGGGFVVANSTVLLHSVTLFCRHGFRVYSMDYPHAPEYRFPVPLISVMRSLAWLRMEKGVRRICLFGDSAGGNLSTMAAALITNPHVRHAFAAEVCPEMALWEFPEVTSQISLYGLLDQESWRGGELPSIGRAENAVALAGLKTCIALYRSPHGAFSNHLSIVDICDRLTAYPRTLLIGARKDPLVRSTHHAFDRLRDRGFDVHLKVFDARHGFFGFPPAWTFGAWLTSAHPAARLMGLFLTTSLGDLEKHMAEAAVTECEREFAAGAQRATAAAAAASTAAAAGVTTEMKAGAASEDTGKSRHSRTSSTCVVMDGMPCCNDAIFIV